MWSVLLLAAKVWSFVHIACMWSFETDFSQSFDSLWVWKPFDVIFTSEHRRFGEVCWHKMHIVLHALSFNRWCTMCLCNKQNLSALQDRRPEQNTVLNAEEEQFVHAVLGLLTDSRTCDLGTTVISKYESWVRFMAVPRTMFTNLNLLDLPKLLMG